MPQILAGRAVANKRAGSTLWLVLPDDAPVEAHLIVRGDTDA
jgi:hypothetical protein